MAGEVVMVAAAAATAATVEPIRREISIDPIQDHIDNPHDAPEPIVRRKATELSTRFCAHRIFRRPEGQFTSEKCFIIQGSGMRRCQCRSTGKGEETRVRTP